MAELGQMGQGGIGAVKAAIGHTNDRIESIQ